MTRFSQKEFCVLNNITNFARLKSTDRTSVEEMTECRPTNKEDEEEREKAFHLIHTSLVLYELRKE